MHYTNPFYWYFSVLNSILNWLYVLPMLCFTYLILHPPQSLVVVPPWSSLMWRDSFVHVNYTQKSIHRLDVFLHALIPFPLFSCLPSQTFIPSSWHCTLSLTLFSSSFSLHMKRSPSFGFGSKTRRVRPAFVLCHIKILPSYVFFLWFWWPVLQTALVAADCGDICIAWDL